MLLKMRIEQAVKNGAETVVLRRAEKKLLEALSSASFRTISEDLQGNLKWYAGLSDIGKLAELTGFFSEKPVVITEYLHTILRSFAPTFVKYMGDMTCIDCGSQRSAILKQEIPTELADIFEQKGNTVELKDQFQFSRTLTLYESVEPTLVHDLDSLVSIVDGKKVQAIKLSKNLRKALELSEVQLTNEDTPEVFLADSDGLSVQRELDEKFALAKLQGNKPRAIRFVGYCAGEEASSINLKEELHGLFGLESFRQYDVYGHDASTYRISQETLIRYLIDQNYREESSDLFFVAATGSGKSLIYQLTGLIIANRLNRLTVVISPLKSLMNDQVSSLKDRFSQDIAAFINSDMSLEEKNQVIEAVSSGKVSMLYVSPEMFVSSSLNSLTGGRRIGLMVIDEAHLVSTWGKTFRVDFGYLGDEIRNARSTEDFPIMATTATAVWGGELDTISEISDLLHLRSPMVVMTDAKRMNIRFTITPFSLDTNARESRTQQKISDTVDSIEKLTEQGKKSIVYCPFVTQAKTIREVASAIPSVNGKLGEYTGQTSLEERTTAHNLFRKGIFRTVVATKAFGMGIDIPDIDVVYHHAVPSVMADYVQEIGRAGRDGRPSEALTHYSSKDPSDSLKLSSLSVPEQWKMKHIMQHLGTLVRQSPNGEIVVSLDDIKYLLITGKDMDKEDRLRDKARIAVFLIQKDLEHRSGKPILIRRAETYQYLFFTAEDNDGEEIMRDYPEVTVECDQYTRNGAYYGENIRSVGKIYRVDIAALWARLFKDRSLQKLVWEFMNIPHTILPQRIYPRISTEISFEKDVSAARRNVQKFIEVLSDYGHQVGRRAVPEDEFFNGLKEALANASILQDVEDQFFKVRNIVRNHMTAYNGNRVCAPFFRCTGEIADQKFSAIMDTSLVTSRWLRKLDDIIADCNNGNCRQFMSVDGDNKQLTVSVLNILDVLGYATVRYSGGESAAIHLKCTDRKYILNNFKNYNCEITRAIRSRIRREDTITRKFFETQMSDQERWQFIENYFLGRIE
ncbi:MAG TPA: DNA helicase II [Kosmotogaceae bacterium]|nr:DNA helicase II [Kosmotogaceae bacterium]